MDIMLYFFTKTTNWGEYLRIQEETNLLILEILEEEGVKVAVPVRAIHVNERDERPDSL